ncbi:MAG: RecX family transcriptional regulator [Chloroflexota bacterium]
MPTVTGLETVETRSGSVVRVFLDGRFAFSLDPVTVHQHAIAVGKVLSESEAAQLEQQSALERALSAAYRLLTYRPRSEGEIRSRLLQKGFDPATTEAALEKLRAQGLLDDLAFGRFWRESRQALSPRGEYLLRAELRHKGLSQETVSEVLADFNEAESALKVARVLRRRLGSLPPEERRRRLWGQLARRGFAPDTIQQVVRQVEREEDGQ